METRDLEIARILIVVFQKVRINGTVEVSGCKSVDSVEIVLKSQQMPQ